MSVVTKIKNNNTLLQTLRQDPKLRRGRGGEGERWRGGEGERGRGGEGRLYDDISKSACFLKINLYTLLKLIQFFLFFNL